MTAAIALAREGYGVDIYEKNKDILSSASGINQYRLHRGYHYPRSPDTAKNCKNHVREFYREYAPSIIYQTEQHYCISKENSLVSAREFLTFCEEMKLEYRIVELDFVSDKNIDICVAVEENIFDSEILHSIVWERLKQHSINLNFGVEADYKTLAPYDHIIISTYTNNNKFLQDYPEDQIEYQYELCENPVVRLPIEFRDKGVVVIDGPFMCFDPFGNTGFHVMGHVVHAIHDTNIGLEPSPSINKDFRKLLNRGIVKNPPFSNYPLFISSAAKFFVGIDKAEHIGSMFTYRTVLPYVEDTDERPTIVQKIDERIITLFSGKIPTCVDAANQVLEIVKNS